MSPNPASGAFGFDSGRNEFEADTGPSRKSTRNSKKENASSMDVLASESGWVSFADDHSVASAFASASSWMGRPVDSDASWLPVAPPNSGAESRHDDNSSSRNSEERYAVELYQPSSDRKDRLPPSGRPSQPRPSTRTGSRSQPLQSNARNDTGSDATNDFPSFFDAASSGGGSERIASTASTDQGSRASGRIPRNTPPRSTRSASGGSRSSRRSRDETSRIESNASHSRGRTSSRARSRSPAPNRDHESSSTSHSSSRRNRSRSKSRHRTSESRGRTRSRSSSRNHVPASHARRSRSTSHARAVDNTGRSTRSRSTSRSGGSSSDRRRSMSRSSSRTPVTGPHTRRSRSLSRTPVPGERSRSRSTTRSARNESRSTRNDLRSETNERSSRRESRPNETRSSRNETKSSRSSRNEGRDTNRTSRSSTSIGPGLPPRQRRGGLDDASASAHTTDERIGSEVSFGRTRQLSLSTPKSASSAGSQIKRREGGLMEKLFGDHVSPPNDRSTSAGSVSSSVRSSTQHDCIHPRVLLSATVYHNSATNLWITTINTNQKGVATNQATASKHLKAFSFRSEREARESAIANAPPKMIPFEDCPNCFVCNGKFAVFRRASHCRNCGVCICSSCSTTWPSKMIPETYNLKKESSVKICKSCHLLSMAFKKSLLSGDYEGTLALYGMGNINLRCPFPSSKDDKKGETIHPIHAAVEGGNLSLVRWLIDDHFCPIKVVRARNSKKGKRRGQGRDVPILTSNGRSVFSIAMAALKIDIMRYLVVKKGVSVYETKDLKAALRSLEATLIALPQRDDILLNAEAHLSSDASDDFSDSQSETCSSLGDTLSPAQSTDGSQKIGARGETEEKLSDACILCYENNIDCVITPCGHQICCLECSSNLSSCPVCNAECEFIRIFKP